MPPRRWVLAIATVAVLVLVGLLPLPGSGPGRGAVAGPGLSAPAGSPTPSAAGPRPALERGIDTLITGAPATELVGDPTLGSFVMTNVPPQGSGLAQGTLKLLSGSAYRVVARMPIGAFAVPRLATDPVNGSIFLSNETGNLSVLSGTTLAPLGTITLAPELRGLAYDAVSGDVLATEGCDASLEILSAAVVAVNATTGAVVAQAPMACSPNGLLVDPLNGNVFVLDGSAGNLTVLSADNLSVLGTVANVSPTLVPGLPPSAAMTFDPRNGLVYVRCTFARSTGCIEAFNGTGAPVAFRLLPTEVQGPVVIDGLGNVDFLAWSNASGSSTEALYHMVPPNGTVSPPTPAGCPNDALGWNPVNQELFALAHCGATGANASLSLFSIRPYSLLTNVPIANTSFFQFPNSGDVDAFDPGSGLMVGAFPVSTGGSAVGLVGPFPVTFHAWILTLGVNWTVNLSFPSGFATAYSSADASIRVFLVNGTYAFRYAIPDGYVESRDGGTVTVAGAAVEETVAFAWAWWFWLIAAVLGVILLVGVRLALDARFEYRVRRAPALAKLRYDLEHRLRDESEEPPYR